MSDNGGRGTSLQNTEEGAREQQMSEALSCSPPVEFWQFLQIQEGGMPFNPAQIKLVNQLL